MFLGWNMPNHYPPYLSFHSELMPAVGIVFLWIGLVTVRGVDAEGNPALSHAAGRRLALPLPTASVAWAVAGLIPLLQYAMGMLLFRADAVLGMLYAWGFAASLYAGYLWSARQGVERVLRVLFLTIVVGGTAANVLGLLQWLRLPVSGWWMLDMFTERPFGNFGQSNHFGLMMVLSTIAATALFELRLVRSAQLFVPLVAFLGVGVLISQSRASALALVCVVVCWFLTRRKVATRLRAPAVLFGIGLWLLLFVSLQRIQDVLGLNSAVRETINGGVRPVMWNHFWTAIMAHPWHGYGFNQGVAAMAEVAAQWPPSPTHSTVYAHDFVLDLMSWGGIPVAVVLAALLGYWLLNWLGKSGNSGLRSQRHLVFSVWLALVVQSLFEYPYAYAYFLLPSALLAGAITQPRVQPAADPPSRAYVASKGALLLALAPAALLVMVAWDYSTLEGDTRIARFARANYADMPQHDFLTEPLVLDVLSTMNQTTLFKLRPGMPPEQLEQMRRVARRIQNAAVQFDYAKALALNGRMTEARHELDILRGLYDPPQYEVIEEQWRNWLDEKKADLPKS